MYSTSSEHTRVPWTAHSYNVSFSDEIGHFEYCQHASANGKCANPGAGEAAKDADDIGCLNADQSLLVPVGGCIGTDFDFDGTSYRADWPGTLADDTRDQQLHAQSFLVTSPLTGGRNYDRLAFEADLPAIEFATGCDTTTGTGCVNPPPGAQFYPIYSSTTGQGACGWREGGTFMPGTANVFGGTSTSEYGPLLGIYYPPEPGFASGVSYEDFRNVLSSNPCPSAGRLPR
jgi:hypothetical protein